MPKISVPKISVVIVTKNRVSELAQCLGSVLANSILPDEIVVVDNNSSDQTRQLVSSLTKNCKIKVKYDLCRGEGYPVIYNRGLELAQGDWVAMIDDDCVVSVDWIKNLRATVAQQQIDVVMGWCGTYYEKNVYSQVTLMFDNEWKRRALNGQVVQDFEILDNKNIAYRRQFLLKNKLRYDEQRAGIAQGAAEDCDLGLQIQATGGQAICNTAMLVWHKDPQNWLWLMKKTIKAWPAYQSLNQKWNLAERQKLMKPSKSLVDVVSDFGTLHHLSFGQELKLLMVAKQIMYLQKILPFYYRLKQ